MTDATTALDGFDEDSFGHGGRARTLLRIGTGPAVLVIPEAPGPTPSVLGFARRVAAIGCTAVVPVLFGEPGRSPSPAYAAQTIGWACVSRQFTTFALRTSSPVTDWLRALGRHEHERCGGPGIGVIGMCLTGGFALAMLADEPVLAPVVSQPSLPFPISGRHKADLGVSDDDWAAGKRRVQAEGLCVLGLRFTADRLCPEDRFARLREELGDHFVGVEIDSSPGNPHGIRRLAHSVVTEDLTDEPGHPTADALAQVLDLFRSRLVRPGR